MIAHELYIFFQQVALLFFSYFYRFFRQNPLSFSFYLSYFIATKDCASQFLSFFLDKGIGSYIKMLFQIGDFVFVCFVVPPEHKAKPGAFYPLAEFFQSNKSVENAAQDIAPEP